MQAFLLSRVLLRFGEGSDDLSGNLSAVTLTPDGSLWVGSDELASVERLSPVAPYVYGEHRPFKLGEFVALPEPDDEIDIEGLDYDGGYLWVTGSHSPKRRKPKGKKAAKDIARIGTITPEPNRYLLARVPVRGGELCATCPSPDDPARELRAASLPLGAAGNLLTEALRDDEHLGPFIAAALPNKENGLDIEGLAARGESLFLGLRGPVLDGWALILELGLAEQAPGALALAPIGPEGRPYKKHFVALNGLGVRDLCLLDDDLIILAGPTMAIEGAMHVFRLRKACGRKSNSITPQQPGALEVVCDLPLVLGGDHAEGLNLFSCLDQEQALLVVYDSPVDARRPSPNALYADALRI